MLKSFKYRLYPTENQRVLLDKHLGSTRFIYNLALKTKKYTYNSNKINLSRFDLSAQLVELKNEATWLKEINSQTIQHALTQLDNAYKKFFKGSGFPKFKKKTSYGGAKIWLKWTVFMRQVGRWNIGVRMWRTALWTNDL